MSLDFAQLEQHRSAIAGHCYRMLGSPVDADDAVQETMMNAWRGLDRFDGRSSLKTWLYRIATNVCLDFLSQRSRRMRPIEDGSPGSVEDELEIRPRTHWLEPVPDVRVIPDTADPAEQLALRQCVRLAFVAALQHLPPKQRAALLLTEVLGCSAAEVAATLETSVASVNSALQRGRATLAQRKLAEPGAALSSADKELVERFADAFERYDVEALTCLLTEDATLSMPPYTLWLRGRQAISAWLRGRGAGCRGSRLVPLEVNGGPGFAQYRDGGATPWAIIALEFGPSGITSLTSFLDVETLFPIFDQPSRYAELTGARAASA